MRFASGGSNWDWDESCPEGGDRKFAGDDLDIFMETYENLKSKGYSESGAFNGAERMTLNKEPLAKKSVRFAKIYDDTSADDNEGSSSN